MLPVSHRVRARDLRLEDGLTCSGACSNAGPIGIAGYRTPGEMAHLSDITHRPAISDGVLEDPTSAERHTPVDLICHHEPVSDSRLIIRPARPQDAPDLQHIEVATQGQFVAIGYDQVAVNPPDSIELLVEYARSGRSWVAVIDNEVVGYILVGVLDDAAHIFHVCVHPAHQGQGLGRALIEQVKSWACSNGRPGVTLATFYEVPWNGPLYEHLGFRVLDEWELGPEMLARGERDMARGVSPEGQVAMRLDLDI